MEVGPMNLSLGHFENSLTHCAEVVTSYLSGFVKHLHARATMLKWYIWGRDAALEDNIHQHRYSSLSNNTEEIEPMQVLILG